MALKPVLELGWVSDGDVAPLGLIGACGPGLQTISCCWGGLFACGGGGSPGTPECVGYFSEPIKDQ